MFQTPQGSLRVFAETHSADTGATGSGAATLTLSSSCGQWLQATAAAKRSLVDSLRSQLSVTYGSQTTSRYVETLDIDCPQQRGESVGSVLQGLGYLG